MSKEILLPPSCEIQALLPQEMQGLIPCLPLFFPGYWWRHHRAQLDEQKQEAEDDAWAALYGIYALDAALRSTDWVLDLAYPPPPEPQPIAPAGEVDWPSQSEVVRAAWGPPELWPAHRIDALSLVQLAQLRRLHSDQRALPAGLSGR